MNNLQKKIKDFENEILNIYTKDYISDELQIIIKDLQARINEPVRIALIGSFSSGKSSLLNALLGKKILPTGAIPITKKINYIKYSNHEQIKIMYKNGREEIIDIADEKLLKTAMKEEEIDYLVLYYPLEILKNITFIDTPGLNSNSELDTIITKKILEKSDGIIWLTSINKAADYEESKFIQEYINGYKSKSLCLITKIDQKIKQNKKNEINIVKKRVNKEWKKYFIQIEPVSATLALENKSNSNIESITKFINKHIIPNKDEIKQQAIDSQIKDILKTIKSEMNQIIQILNQLEYKLKDYKLKETHNHNLKNTLDKTNIPNNRKKILDKVIYAIHSAKKDYQKTFIKKKKGILIDSCEEITYKSETVFLLDTNLYPKDEKNISNYLIQINNFDKYITTQLKIFYTNLQKIINSWKIDNENISFKYSNKFFKYKFYEIIDKTTLLLNKSKNDLSSLEHEAKITLNTLKNLIDLIYDSAKDASINKVIQEIKGKEASFESYGIRYTKITKEDIENIVKDYFLEIKFQNNYKNLKTDIYNIKISQLNYLEEFIYQINIEKKLLS